MQALEDLMFDEDPLVRRAGTEAMCNMIYLDEVSGSWDLLFSLLTCVALAPFYRVFPCLPHCFIFSLKIMLFINIIKGV